MAGLSCLWFIVHFHLSVLFCWICDSHKDNMCIARI
jgi:hypothetical protein